MLKIKFQNLNLTKKLKNYFKNLENMHLINQY